MVVGDPLHVSAVAFQAPPEISNRQKAHLDIAYTGGDTGECSATNSENIVGGAGTKVSKEFSLGTNPKERRVNLVKALRASFGLTAAQAAGPVGNFVRESGGEDIPPDVNQGGVKGPPNGSGLGYGWAQWSGGRKTAFVNFIKDNGYVDEKGHATDAGNYAFLTHELSTGYKSTITELKKQKTPEEAAVSFEATYEKAGVPALSDRTKAARQAFNEYNGTDGGDASEDPASENFTPLEGCASGEAGGAVGSADYGQVVFPLAGNKSVVKNPGMFNNGDTDRGGHPYIAYDILANTGTEVVAFAAGTVTYTSVDRCGGKFLSIWNDQAKLAITYMHLSSHIPEGKSVKPGDNVGVVGSTAQGCTVPHLHIDSSTDKIRQPCSRNSCPVANHFRSIGKELYDAYQALPGN